VPVASTQVAEFTKLLENIYRCVNIGLANEMKTVADEMDELLAQICRHPLKSHEKTRDLMFAMMKASSPQ